MTLVHAGDGFPSGDTVNRPVDVEVEILVDETDRPIAEGGMSAAGMHALGSRLAIRTDVTSHADASGERTVGTSMDIGSTVSIEAIVDSGAAIVVVTAPHQ